MPGVEDCVSTARRTLRVEFEDVEAFQREYASNLSNGGVFVRSDEAFEAREGVEVELAFPYANRSLTLVGEIVDIVPAGLTAVGGTAAAPATAFAMLMGEARRCLPHEAGQGVQGR